MEDTIAAISTTAGVGAISIIRLSGEEALKITNKVFTKDLTTAASHTIHYGYIKDGNEKIDEVLVSVMLAPKTFTREDVVEINCHGGIATTNKVLELLLNNGARLAEPGEFTKRAFLNGRIDLLEAEATMDLISSKSDKARKMSLNTLTGETSNLIKDLRSDIVGIISNIEVNIDYPEYEDIEVLTNEKILPEIQKFKDGNDPLYPNTDWYDEIYQTGVQHSHSVSVNGGTDDVKYMGAVSYLHQTGILPHAMRRQFSGRTNLDVKLSSRLNARLNLAYINNNYSDPTDSYTGGGSYQIINLASKMAPWIVGRYEDGTYGTISDGSPLAWLDAKQTVDRMNQNFTGSLSLDYQILDELKATVTGSYVNNQQHYKEFRKEIIYNPNKKSNPNQPDERFYGWERGTFDALLNYDKQFDVHGLKAMAGYHLEKYNYRENQSIRKNFPTNDLDDMNAGDAATQTNSGYTRELAMISWFARLNYDYSGKYLFEANIRADASSRFSDGNRWGYFPSFSAAWRISEENFMESSRDWLDNLKIRTSWGLLGNQNALSDYYPWLNTYQLDGKYNFGSGLKTGYYLDSYKLSTISWEKACTWGIGVDASFFNCVDLSVDFYDRKTTGIIMDVPVPKEFGLKPYKDNVGEMLNRGVEVTLGYHKKWGKWTLGATGNFAYNKNELLDLGGVDYMVDPGDKYKRRQIGERLNSYYAYKTNGFFQSDEEAQAWMDKYSKLPGYPFGTRKFKGGDLIYQDTDGVEGITENDRVLLGSMDPAWTFGLNLNAGYKGWDISMMFSGAANVSRMFTNPGDFNGDMARPTTLWLDAWTPENKDATMPRVAYDVTSPSLSSNVVSTFWLQNSSYLRMKNLQFGYTLPKNVIKSVGIENVRFYYSVENLFTIHNMLVNVDPEIGDERGSSFPLTQTHAFGVNVTF